MLRYPVPFLILLLLTGCALLSREIPLEETSAPPPTPILCSPLPANMTFQVTPLSHTSLNIAMTGLQPGEIPVVRVIAQTSEGSLDGTYTQTKPVDNTGQYDFTVNNLELNASQPPDWHIMVTHAHGVACETIRLP